MIGSGLQYWTVVAGVILAAVVMSGYVLAMMLRQQQAMAEVRAKREQRLREHTPPDESDSKATTQEAGTERKAA